MNDETILTPCYVVEEEKLIKNLEILKRVIDRTGCHILLAQKCFSMFSVYPLIGHYLNGTTASGLYEARLAHEYMDGENHIYAAAYREEEMDEIVTICDHIVFNSFSQWTKYKKLAQEHKIECGIRINPQCSTQEGHAIYDPCAPFSRMGVTKENFRKDLLEGISGLHFHTLCEQDSIDLVTTLQAVEEQFGHLLPQMKWLNLGGGHHITKEGYDIEKLITNINRMQNKYDLEIYLEPGEAVALNAGYLLTEVLDIIENGMSIAIVDTSAACHMPDVLEMPYRPSIEGAFYANEKKYTYRLGGPTCLAGDIIGDYSFEDALKVGSRLKLCDMAIYSMVKNNTFNGMKLPSIVLKKGDMMETIKVFGYEDFKMRLS
ncbi:carboxynorspermidine decarboxylase [Lachnotalea glycerini]|uniref:carboxynorspermidine decarboxylase n=1 Tax=Lachnotalea glycerini TaxID=1763509 RepID=UPI0015F27A35|nr:carboxynorspermidine decarboxylase [Lachnotalea glycerini]